LNARAIVLVQSPSQILIVHSQSRIREYERGQGNMSKKEEIRDRVRSADVERAAANVLHNKFDIVEQCAASHCPHE
jgi:hypothetical protein